MILPEYGYTPINLITLMANRKLKTSDVAKMLDVRRESVSRWRRGRVSMPHDKWVKLMQS